MEIKNKKILLYLDDFLSYKELSNEELGELFRCVLDYYTTKQYKVENRLIQFIFERIKNNLDNLQEKYNQVAEKRKLAGSLGGKQKVANASKCYNKLAKSSKCYKNVANSSNNNNININNNNNKNINNNIYNNQDINQDEIQLENQDEKKKKREVFVKPEQWEVEEEYFVKTDCKKSDEEISRFAKKFLNYYDSQGWKIGKNPMKDWRACVRTWILNEKK